MANHVNFEDIERYIREKVYPSEIGTDKGKKANFRRACNPFTIVDGQLMYNDTRCVIYSKEDRQKIINDIQRYQHFFNLGNTGR